ncbi:NACHT domain-containing protein [Jidongwangia harbinensis]|uniref:NACHT domain-containing protein n=1 Tax=Jidongwangia harbinensis TaxID=2878561 RepID=UPI001CD95AAA|nr:hypothetical protein [Jidongwangia harbinensis]MCA2216080.1 hypothetical protein [Jidongwangia harbinensis]
MPQRLRYADAVKLLGGLSPAGQAVDNLLGSALTIATAGGSDVALGLFDAKAEMVRLGHVVAGRINDSVRGLGRYDRTQRLQAAHGILVVTSFFEAFDAAIRPTALPAPDLTRDDEIRLAAGTRVDGDWLHRLLSAPLPVPSPERSYAQLVRDLSAWFSDAAARFLDHLRGLAVWDAADDRTRAEVLRLLTVRLPEDAVARYQEVHRRLAVDVPEFAVWLHRTESQAAGRGLAALEATLRRATSGRDPDRHRAALAAAYRADLDRPILGTDDGGVTLPRLGEAYVDPIFRAQEAGPDARPGDENWWTAEPRTDVAGFLAAYLTTPRAAAAPMLLLGHPGAGKSSLLTILAARLPAADFLAVRVVLREVPAEAEIQDQIEQALRSAIGESVAWADLARSAAGAMPVVLLDGFDELLQATGVHQSDYLRRVAAFQSREAVQGRPVAVIVTSRVAVADRARLPPDGLAVRLDPFDRFQVRQWLDTWNAVTAADLPVHVVWRFADLSSQPLLLLMLALYDAGTGALRDAGATLGVTDLYERLLGDFTRREVRRLHVGQPDEVVADLVEAELNRLSVVAFAMFNRGRQWVTEEEVDDDLTGLGIAPARSAPPKAFRSPLTAGQELVGRFFFIQRAQARAGGRIRQAYEFLHATFGEYLVSRLLVGLLRNPADGELLESLLGFQPLTTRHTVLAFTAALLDDSDRPQIRERLLERLRTALLQPAYVPRAYRPARKRADQWMGTYSLNLVLLTLACGEPLRASELFRQARDPAAWLRAAAQMWRSAVPSGMWLDTLAILTVHRTWADGRRDVILRPGAGADAEPVDPLWSYGRPDAPPGTGFSAFTPLIRALRSMHLSDHRSDDLLRHAVQPVLDRLPDTLTHFTVHERGDAESIGHGLLALWLASLLDDDPAGLVRAYDRVVAALSAPDRWSTGTPADRVADTYTVVLRSLARDADRVPVADLVRWLGALRRQQAHLTARHVPAVLACLDRVPADGSPEATALREWGHTWAHRVRVLPPEEAG